jgi:TPR repeat protein
VASAGDLEAMAMLARALRSGSFGNRDVEGALKWVRPAAERGNTAAMNELGTMFFDGSMPRDLQQARQYFERAAAAGYARAQANLATLYKTGQGVPQDYEQAWRLYEKAAAAGETIAMINLGDMTEHGWGVRADSNEARNWYEKAAARGNADSLWHLALMADRGIGMHVDPLQAADRAMTALKKGSTEALALLSDTNQVLTGETLAEIQRVLTARGLYSGPLQMRLSPAAREGLRKWATES